MTEQVVDQSPAEEQLVSNPEVAAQENKVVDVDSMDPEAQMMLKGMCAWHQDAMSQLHSAAMQVKNDPSKLVLERASTDEGEPNTVIEVTADMANTFAMGILAAVKLLESFPLKYSLEEIPAPAEAAANEDPA